MKFVLLLYYTPGTGPAPDTPEHAAEMARWREVHDEMAEAGVLVASHALQPAGAAVTLRAPDGLPVVNDGPVAPAKEMLFGYFQLDVADRAAAATWAAKLPHAAYGSVEIRPLME